MSLLTQKQIGAWLSISAPTVTDDSSKAFNIGSIWAKTDTRDIYICTDNTAGAAVWQKQLETVTTENTQDFTPTLGQTSFALDHPPITVTLTKLYLNGQRRKYGVGVAGDFSVSGTTLTWNDPSGLTLKTTDLLIVDYVY